VFVVVVVVVVVVDFFMDSVRKLLGYTLVQIKLFWKTKQLSRFTLLTLGCIISRNCFCCRNNS